MFHVGSLMRFVGPALGFALLGCADGSSGDLVAPADNSVPVQGCTASRGRIAVDCAAVTLRHVSLEDAITRL